MLPRTGDKVRFLDEKGEGTVTGFTRDGYALVRIDDGFEIPYVPKKLVIVERAVQVPPPEEPEAAPTAEATQPVPVLPRSDRKAPKPAMSLQNWRLKAGSDGRYEVDLHIDELLESTSGMDNAAMIIYQLGYFEKCLDEARQRNIRRFVVIHGVGKGRLREEIRKLLHAEDIEYYDASYQKYGYGATEIRLK